QLVVHGKGQRIARLWPVECHVPDAVPHLIDDVLIAARRLSPNHVTLSVSESLNEPPTRLAHSKPPAASSGNDFQCNAVASSRMRPTVEPQDPVTAVHRQGAATRTG